jgi:hypothetical protein
MKALKRGAFLWLLATLPACGQQLVEFPRTDGAEPDAAGADGAIPDVAVPEAAILDAEIWDTGNGDAFDIVMNIGATACGGLMACAWVGGSGAFICDSNVVSVPGNGCPL